MTIRTFFKRSDTIVGLVRDIRKLLRIPHIFLRPIFVNSYLKKNHIKKLQIGAGHRGRSSWLCSDINPTLGKIIYLNAARPLPFEDKIFDYIFSEHMIEHISYKQGVELLQECCRIIRPGGKIRITTPDLEVILGLHTSSPSDSQKEYIKWITDKYIGGNSYNAPLVISNAFQNWGHQFLYDKDTLESALKQAGFADLKQYRPGESDDEHLRGLECHGDNIGNDAMNQFESMVIEGVRLQ